MLVTGYVQTGITASGVYTVPGVAACPLWLPFGTVVVIDGVRQVSCLDRYSPLLSDRIDVWVTTVAEAYSLTGLHEVVIND